MTRFEDKWQDLTRNDETRRKNYKIWQEQEMTRNDEKGWDLMRNDYIWPTVSTVSFLVQLNVGCDIDKFSL